MDAIIEQQPVPMQPTEDPPQEASLQDMPKKKRRPWLFALKAVVSLGLIAWIISGANLKEVAASVRGVSLPWLGLAVTLQLLGPAIISLRWKGLLAAKGVCPSWMYLYKSTLVSGFFRQFLPSIVGGDAIRGVDAWKAGAGKGLAVTSLVVDRLLGLVALALFAVVALMFSSSDLIERIPGVRLWALLGLLGTLTMTVVLFAPVSWTQGPVQVVLGKLPGFLSRKLGKMWGALTVYSGHHAALGRAFGLSLLLQANVVTFYWAISQSLGLSIGYEHFYVIVPIAIFVMMAPISINGIGLREGVFTFLLAEVFLTTRSEALALAWIEYGIFLGFGLLGGVIYALRRQ